MKKFYIKTLGCKVNQCDSQEIRERFLERGLKESRHAAWADILIVNTCCVTHQADRKSRQAIRENVRHKKDKNSFLAVTGCYAGYDFPAIKNINGVDAVFALDKRDEFFKCVERIILKESPAVSPAVSFGNHTRGFLKIQEGCDNHCSYCIVPFVRGKSRSKEYPLALEEARRLVDAGHPEIVLTGVSLGSFGRDLPAKNNLVDFIGDLEKIKDLSRIRLSSIEASDVSPELIAKMADSEKLCPHLHIPFQSGDDTVLKDMNKKLFVKDYCRIVGAAYKRIKNLAITCDFIVGYPCETEANFENTLSFVRFLRPLKAHLFTFSPRKGTALFNKKIKCLSPTLVKARFTRIKELSDLLSLEYKKRYIGKELTVLFEDRTTEGWRGYSQNYIRVVLRDRKPLKDRLALVRVSEVSQEGVFGQSNILAQTLAQTY
jgi:threonylcarbamoyladenosine tRNA methylthiotransferase MtaB